MINFSTDELVRVADVARALGVSRQTLVRWAEKGNFPPLTQLGPRVRGWHRSEIEPFLRPRG